MKVMAFGSCMSNLTIAWLTADYGFEQTHSIHHNRSDSFIRYYIDRSAAMIPQDYLEALLIPKPEMKTGADEFLHNQLEKYLGYFQLAERKTRPDQTFFSDMMTTKLDLVVMDNYMDLASKLLYFRNLPEYRESPLFLNCGFYQNEADILRLVDWWGDYLSPQESAENFVVIYRWLRGLQPQAKFVFLPFHTSSSRNAPERFARARDFYPALVDAARGEDLHVVPPLELAPELTKGEDDWPHFQMPLYRALAGHVYLATVAGLPEFRDPALAQTQAVRRPLRMVEAIAS